MQNLNGNNPVKNSQKENWQICEKIKKTIMMHDMISPGNSIVVGLSGGPDSVCLFHVLCRLKDELQINDIYAVHINHGLRGMESDGDEAYSRSFAESLGAVFFSRKYDVAEIAKQDKVSTEDAGRKIRYSEFETIREKTNSQRIAVAHNMDDQAETILMRIMRGTGLKGLSGIDYVRRDGVVIRPILDLSRKEVERYCELNDLKPRIDSTNKESIYTRNKVRLELIPLMEERFNPQVMEAVVRLGKQATEDESFLMEVASDEWKKRWHEKEKELDISGLVKLHAAVAKRVLFLCVEAIGIEQNVGSVQIESLWDLIAGGNKVAETDLARGVYARISHGETREKVEFLCREKSNLNEQTQKITESVSFPFSRLEHGSLAGIKAGCWNIQLSWQSTNASMQSTNVPMQSETGGKAKKKTENQGVGVDDAPVYTAKIDAVKLKKFLEDAVNSSLEFRNRLPGDKIKIRGMNGTKKLQNYFTDRKISVQERDIMPLAALGNLIIAAGSEVSAYCAADGETSEIITVNYYQAENFD